MERRVRRRGVKRRGERREKKKRKDEKAYGACMTREGKERLFQN